MSLSTKVRFLSDEGAKLSGDRPDCPAQDQKRIGEYSFSDVYPSFTTRISYVFMRDLGVTESEANTPGLKQDWKSSSVSSVLSLSILVY